MMQVQDSTVHERAALVPNLQRRIRLLMISNSSASHSRQVEHHSGLVEECVETLCGYGCIRVSNYIELLEAGRFFPEVAALDAEQRAEVLAELISIMAAYNGVCGR